MRDPLICSCYCNVNCVFLCLGLLPGWLEMFISSFFAALRLLSLFRESLCSLRLSALRRNRCRDCFNIQLEGFKQCWDGHVSPSLLFSSLFSTSISVLFLLQLKCNTSLTLLRMSVHLLSFCICFLSFRQTVMTHIRWVFLWFVCIFFKFVCIRFTYWGSHDPDPSVLTLKLLEHCL